MQKEDPAMPSVNEEGMAKRMETLFRNAGDDPLMLSLRQALLEYRLGRKE